MRDKKYFLAVLGILFFLAVFAWLAVYGLAGSELEAVFFDVGQGDAALIQLPRGRQILIDGGPSSAILEKLAKEMPFWDRTIDFMVLTHPEQDHLAGLLDVLKRYKVKNILWTGAVRDTAEYKEWVDLIAKEKANIIIAKAGLKPGFGLEILSPFEDWQGREVRDSNMTSIVLRLDFGFTSFLFTGDIREFEEREMILRGANLDSDILKVGHHGSKTSSSDEFVAKVLPELAVISAGLNNSYGHPRQEVLDILDKYGIKVFRTDFDGDIKIISDGETYGVSYIQN